MSAKLVLIWQIFGLAIAMIKMTIVASSTNPKSVTIGTTMFETLDFTGDAVTYLGFLGVISTLIIMVSVFRSFYKSPLHK